MTRFLILGLPRSGTTYLMTLLNSHRAVYCSGEQFNPYAIVGIGGERNDDFDAVTARDRDPIGFFEAFFAAHAAPGRQAVGFKFMLGHNIQVLDHIARSPDLKLLHVWRDNKLAQVSSYMQALQTKRWAETNPAAVRRERLNIGPRNISQHWHEMSTVDYLFEPWFERLPHDRMSVEYREMFAPGFEARVCAFLGLDPDPQMMSPLVKQGANTILDRFDKPDAFRSYFGALGLEHWLGDEV